jgi:hypothetical protein
MRLGCPRPQCVTTSSQESDTSRFRGQRHVAAGFSLGPRRGSFNRPGGKRPTETRTFGAAIAGGPRTVGRAGRSVRFAVWAGVCYPSDPGRTETMRATCRCAEIPRVANPRGARSRLKLGHRLDHPASTSPASYIWPQSCYDICRLIRDECKMAPCAGFGESLYTSLCHDEERCSTIWNCVARLSRQFIDLIRTHRRCARWGLSAASERHSR